MKQYFSHRLTTLLLCLTLLGALTLPSMAANPGTGAATPSVTLDKTAVSLVADDAEKNTASLAVTIQPEGTAYTNIGWSTSNRDLVLVDRDPGDPTKATLTAKDAARSSKETVTITATVTLADPDAQPLTATCQVTWSKKITELELNLSEHTLEPPAAGAAAQPWKGLRATVVPASADYNWSELTWTSSDLAVATVEWDPATPNLPTITPVAVGRTTITATLGATGFTASCVIDVSGVTLPEKLTLTLGDVYEFATDENYRIYGNAATQLTVWESSSSTVASVSSGSRLVARRVGQTTITINMGPYSATCDVTVEEDVADAIFAPDINTGERLTFGTLLSQLQGACASQLTNDPLLYLTGLSVPTSAGVIYYGYISPDSHNHGVGGSERYYVGGSGVSLLEDVSFVPAGGFSDTAIISYTGVGANGGTFRGTIRVKVNNTGDVAYSTANNRAVPMEVSDFAAVCQSRTGGSLRSVVFYDLPSATHGTFYYNYSPAGQFSQKVSATTQYRVDGNSSLLENVTFVPYEDYVGTLSIPYYAYNASNNRYSGTLTIQIYAADGSTSNANVTYYASRDSVTTIGVADFQNAYINANSGYSTLSHIYFTALPDALEEGSLYYNYTSAGSYGARVSTSNRYYVDGYSTPSLSLVSFVPVSGFTGTVTIPYTGYDAGSVPFNGKLIIHVSEGSQGIRYTTGPSRPVTFQQIDFTEACQTLHRSALRDITFQLPDIRMGTLYYNYVSSSLYNSPVTAGTRYWAGQISSITFVPAASFTGTVAIPFNGQAESGVTFSGSVYIDVGASRSDTVRYTTVSGGWVTFSPADFNAASLALTGENLDYVTFTSSGMYSQGTLYQSYNPTTGTGTYAYSSTRYYRSSGANLLGQLSFVAATNYLGTVKLDYSGVSVGGLPFQGAVEITVTTPMARDIRYNTRALPVSFTAADFRTACNGILRNDLSYIRIAALPDSSRGKLLLNYSGPGTGTAAVAATSYYLNSAPSLNSLVFLPRAGFSGTVSIRYTATDIRGNSVPGTIIITVGSGYGSDPFRDTNSYPWAEPAIEFLHRYGIVTGSGGGSYSPGSAIKRCDFTLMLCRTFDFEPVYGSSFPDVSSDAYYATALSTAKSLGIILGDDKGNFNPTDSLTRQDAMVMLQRALKAAGISTPTVSTQVLTTLYPDGAHVSSYAQPAMAAMIQLGVIQGDDTNRLNPRSALRRAEMAVILHRVLTY